MYKEKLPEQCPPASATDQPLIDVWRFLKVKSAEPECFKSFAALGRENKKSIPDCDWASCSLFTPRDRVMNLAKLPLFKNMKAAAELNIPAGSGKSVVNDNGHVDFWMYSHFDPCACVTSIVSL